MSYGPAMDAPMFHHVRHADFSPHGVVYPTSPLGETFAREYAPAYRWLAEQCGFAPLFLAVGATSTAWDMTGFEQADERGEVCFSWHGAPAPVVYSDYMEWHVILNAIDDDRDTLRPLGDLTPRRVMRPRRSEAEWLAASAHEAVQGTVPHLDLTTADVITCPNRELAEQVLAQGFARDRIRIAAYRPRVLPGGSPLALVA